MIKLEPDNKLKNSPCPSLPSKKTQMTCLLQPEIQSPTPPWAELERMVLKDLLGPAGDSHEIVAEPTVRGRYVLGILTPKGQTVLLAEEEDQDDQIDLATADEDTQDGAPDLAAPEPLHAAPGHRPEPYRGW